MLIIFSEEEKQEEINEEIVSATLKRRNVSLTQAHGDNEEVESVKNSPEKPERPTTKPIENFEMKVNNPQNVNKAGTYTFVAFIGLALLLLISRLFKFQVNESDDFEFDFGENIGN